MVEATYGLKYLKAMYTELKGSWTQINWGNGWYNLIAVRDDNDWKIFINGELTNTKAEELTLNAVEHPSWIGRSKPYGNAYDGIIDDIRIYNRALNESEVSGIYTNSSYELTIEDSDNGSINDDSGSYGLDLMCCSCQLQLQDINLELDGRRIGNRESTENKMDTDKTIGATFAKDTADTDEDGFSNYDELIVHKTDPADSNDYPLESGVDTLENGSTTFTESHKLGTETTITALPDIGYVFSKWTGDASGTDNPLAITMDEIKRLEQPLPRIQRIQMKTGLVTMMN